MSDPYDQITFREPSFLLFDVDRDGACTTEHGNLAIFSTRAMAEVYASRSLRKIKVVPVMIAPITEH